MLENGMLLGTPSPDDCFVRNEDDYPVDWDEEVVESGASYYGVHDSYGGNRAIVLVKDDPDEILRWLGSTEYEHNKPAFIKRYSELDTSSVIDDMMNGWFIKNNKARSDLEFFELYVNKEFYFSMEA